MTEPPDPGNGGPPPRPSVGWGRRASASAPVEAARPSAWGTPTPSARPKRRVGRIIIRVLAGLIAAFGVVAVIGYFLDKRSDTRKVDAFLDGKGVLFASDVSRFRARFPSAPKYEEKSIRVGGELRSQVTFRTSVAGTSVAVAYYDFDPATVTLDLPGAAEGAAQGVNGTLVHNELLTFLGHEAIDYTIEGGADEAWLHGRTVVAERRVYFIEASAHSRKTTDALFAQLIESFVLTSLP